VQEIYKRMKKALDFVMSMKFWRMGLLWTFSLLISYWKLFFAQTSRSSSPSFESRPVCIITGVSDPNFVVSFFNLIVMDITQRKLQASSELGAAAAHVLSSHGFFVVLGNHIFNPIL
jgi:hypothetical protein